MYAFLTLLLIVFSSCAPHSPSNVKSLLKAESYTSDGDYEAAIVEYKKHIKSRALEEDRPEWENPYFYLLLIGDLHLQLAQPKQALKSYLEADTHKVSAILVNDRIRMLASWYEENEQFENAVELLKKYRERDTLMFDLMLDRISKKIVQKQDHQEKSE